MKGRKMATTGRWTLGGKDDKMVEEKKFKWPKKKIPKKIRPSNKWPNDSNEQKP
jgi:hypothetical protein